MIPEQIQLEEESGQISLFNNNITISLELNVRYSIFVIL